MNSFADFLLSPGFASIAQNVAIIAVMVSAAAIIFGFWHYGRGREGRGKPRDPWILVIATLRDSFILSLLYSAQSLTNQAGGLHGYASAESMTGMTLSAAAIFSSVIFEFAIILVAGLRILALTEWLNGTPNEKP